MEKISVFDIFKISIGPSSSHTMGPWVAANVFRKEIEQHKIKSLKIKLYGSLAKTGKGHGTDIAVILGLCNYDVKTVEVEKIHEHVAQLKTEQKIQIDDNSIPFNPETDILFDYESIPPHPNTISFEAAIDSTATISATYYSVGGGFIIKEGAEADTKEQLALPYPIQDGDELTKWTTKTGLSIAEIVFQNELSWRDEAAIHASLDEIWLTMLECMYRGCHKTGNLPGGLNVSRRAAQISNDLLHGIEARDVQEWKKLIKISNAAFVNVIKWVSCFAMAVNEENAAFGRVVTAPTNGAAGVIPAVLMYLLCFHESREGEKKTIHKFLLVAGEIGSLFKKGATISAAMGGCQAEIGVSSAMAAGALTACLNGTTEQVLMAAEIAMEHHLGLTCDPINGLVQIPCIERNTMGAIKAITANQIALSSDAKMAKVSLDSVIKTMMETATDMQDKYKETAEGGLAAHVSVVVSEC